MRKLLKDQANQEIRKTTKVNNYPIKKMRINHWNIQLIVKNNYYNNLPLKMQNINSTPKLQMNKIFPQVPKNHLQFKKLPLLLNQNKNHKFKINKTNKSLPKIQANKIPPQVPPKPSPSQINQMIIILPKKDLHKLVKKVKIYCQGRPKENKCRKKMNL